jgi:hypothetical protein
MKKITLLLLIAFLSLGLYSQTWDMSHEMTGYNGFFDFYYHEKEDRIYLVVDQLEREFLYLHSLSSGIGSNDLGLDRGQLGGTAVVIFQKAGNRILMVQPNLDYRATTSNRSEKAAVEQAFARSVLYGFEIVDQKDGKYLIDLSPMLFSDAHGVAERLDGMSQGSFHVDLERSAIELSRTKAFPKNVEFEALLTFSGKPEGALIRSVTPEPHHLSVVQHHSFVQLPGSGYEPRVYDPRSGCISISFMDFASPVYEPIRKQWIIRHRLEKKDPGKTHSEAVEPIVYYVDNGTPEPIRTALLEGGSWWNEAFEAIGFKDAFRMEVLPEDADPLDVRYNVVQWVHRSTRGWSYGNSVVDPRTGEIIKGHVSLGSLRIRQDFMIAQALMDRPYASDDENHHAMMELALARIRQLSAHEIGHTLGFTHNFAASSNDRSSVMDYPHPLLTVADDQIRMDNAYTEGIGEWDKVMVAYAYSDFGKKDESQLRYILEQAHRQGLRYISDLDARAAGGAHPYAHLWDNGGSAVEELNRILEIRQIAIRNFSIDNIRTGEPYAYLEDLFVPLFLFHRYQVEAVSKLIGGVMYEYGVKGDQSTGPEAVASDIQREALSGVLLTLTPEVIMIPQEKLVLFPPRAPGYERTPESFEGQTGITFDYLAPPSVSANLTLTFLLHPERANRLVEQNALDANLPGLEEVIGELLQKTLWTLPDQPGYESEIRHTVNFIVLDHLIRLSDQETASPQVRAIVKRKLEELKEQLDKVHYAGVNEACRAAYVDQITEGKVRYLPYLPPVPPGAPIGMECQTY